MVEGDVWAAGGRMNEPTVARMVKARAGVAAVVGVDVGCVPVVDGAVVVVDEGVDNSVGTERWTAAGWDLSSVSRPL